MTQSEIENRIERMEKERQKTWTDIYDRIEDLELFREKIINMIRDSFALTSVFEKSNKCSFETDSEKKDPISPSEPFEYQCSRCLHYTETTELSYEQGKRCGQCGAVLNKQGHEEESEESSFESKYAVTQAHIEIDAFDRCPECKLYIGPGKIGSELLCNQCSNLMIRDWIDPVEDEQGFAFWKIKHEEPSATELSKEELLRIEIRKVFYGIFRTSLSFESEKQEAEYWVEQVLEQIKEICPLETEKKQKVFEAKAARVLIDENEVHFDSEPARDLNSLVQDFKQIEGEERSRQCPKCLKLLHVFPKGKFRCYYCRAEIEWKGTYWQTTGKQIL